MRQNSGGGGWSLMERTGDYELLLLRGHQDNLDNRAACLESESLPRP